MRVCCAIAPIAMLLWLIAAQVCLFPAAWARGIPGILAAGGTGTAGAPDASAEWRSLGDTSGQARPRVFVYSIPEPLATLAGVPQLKSEQFRLVPRLKESPFYEPDPSKADYFWIPSLGRPGNTSVPSLLIDYVRSAFPYFNMTVARGEARHILLTELDCGPNENFGWERTVKDPQYSPGSLTRNVIYLAYNGANDYISHDVQRASCLVCFQRGKDIMLPTKEAVCGPLCGYNRETLRATSMWMRPEDQLRKEMERRRSHLLFFAGNMHADGPETHSPDWDFTGRAGLYYLYHNHSRYHINHRSSHNVHNRSANVKFQDAMSDAEFCYSPMGTSGGDTDRYVAATLFGCIPVMLNTSHSRYHRIPHALPFEEVLPWHEFGTLADNYNLATLDQQLRCLLPRVPQMRQALQRHLPSLLWSSLYGPYLAESGEGDAFETLMRVLASRIPHGYKPSEETLRRFSHPGTLFPCRPDSPDWPGEASKHSHHQSSQRQDRQ